MGLSAMQDSRGLPKMRYSSVKGFQISRIGLGTVQFGMDYGYTKKLSQAGVDNILYVCRNHGINFLDTARNYGDSELKIGSYLRRHPLGDWFIATKIGGLPKDVCSRKPKIKDHILASLEASRKSLGREMQLVQLHDAEPHVVRNPRLWDVIADLKAQGELKDFGVSFYEPDEARLVLKKYSDLITCIQVPFNIFDRRFAGLFPLLRLKRIKLISRSTFLRGLITVGNDATPSDLAGLKPYKEKFMDFSARSGLSINESALLYAYNTDLINTVLVGVKSASELESNIAALQKLRIFRKYAGELSKLKVNEPYLIDPRRWKPTKVSFPKAQVKKLSKAPRVLAILQARMGSTRLPGKVLRPIMGKPMLLRMIERVRASQEVDHLVVATTVSPSDDVIEEFCRKHSIRCFRGSENDVLDRFFQAARKFGGQSIVRITGDCPLMDPEVLDKVIRCYFLGAYDYASNTVECTFPDGLDVEVFSAQAMGVAHKKAKLLSEREHVTPFF